MLEKKELYPIYGLWHKPFWQTNIFYFIVGFVLLFILFLIIFFLIKKYIKRKYKKTAWQDSLCELDNLKKLVLKDKIRPKNFYLSLTEIIKKYLFNRFAYDLFGFTDKEVINFLENKKFNKYLLETITTMFESMQVIKFAAKSAAKELMEKDLERSVDLVNKTIPKNK